MLEEINLYIKIYPLINRENLFFTQYYKNKIDVEYFTLLDGMKDLDCKYNNIVKQSKNEDCVLNANIRFIDIKKTYCGNVFQKASLNFYIQDKRSKVILHKNNMQINKTMHDIFIKICHKNNPNIIGQVGECSFTDNTPVNDSQVRVLQKESNSLIFINELVETINKFNQRISHKTWEDHFTTLSKLDTMLYL